MSNSLTQSSRVRTLRLLCVALSAILLAACGASYQRPAAVALPDPVSVPSPPAPNLKQCDDDTGPPVPAVSSYEMSTDPLPALPTPGQMPAGSYMRTIQDRGFLIVGTSIDTNLFSSVNPATNEIEGFDVDMAALVAEAIFGPQDPPSNIRSLLDLRGITYAQRIPTVASGEADLIAHTMTINCKRWQQVAFSGVYLNAGQKLLVAKGSPVTTVEELAGQRVCVAAGGTSAEEMRNLAVTPPIDVTEVQNQTDCVVRFQRGEVDAIRSDDTVLAGFQDQDKLFSEIVGDLLTNEPYGMATSLDHPEFTQFVNVVLERAKQDGSWRAAYDKWLLGSLKEPVVDLKEPDVRGAFPHRHLHPTVALRLSAWHRSISSPGR